MVRALPVTLACLPLVCFPPGDTGVLRWAGSFSGRMLCCPAARLRGGSLTSGPLLPGLEWLTSLGAIERLSDMLGELSRLDADTREEVEGEEREEDIEEATFGGVEDVMSSGEGARVELLGADVLRDLHRRPPDACPGDSDAAFDKPVWDPELESYKSIVRELLSAVMMARAKLGFGPPNTQVIELTAPASLLHLAMAP